MRDNTDFVQVDGIDGRRYIGVNTLYDMNFDCTMLTGRALILQKKITILQYSHTLLRSVPLCPTLLLSLS